MLDTISKIIEDEVCYAYCNNCKYNMDDERCEGCHRKYMNWQLSHESAVGIAEKIIKAIDEF